MSLIYSGVMGAVRMRFVQPAKPFPNFIVHRCVCQAFSPSHTDAMRPYITQ